MGGFFQDAAGGLAYGSANDFDDADDPHRNVSRPGARGAHNSPSGSCAPRH